MARQRKQHFIDFHRDASDAGDPSPSFEQWCPNVPAAVMDIGGGESYRGRQIEANSTTIFHIEYLQGVDETMQIKHDGVYYEINRIDDPGHMHRELIIQANAINRYGS